MTEPIITTEAERIGNEIRTYVREHFELRERLDITPLDDLSAFVTRKVAEAMQKTHGQFLCSGCFAEVDVERVRCRHCSDPTNAQAT